MVGTSYYGVGLKAYDMLARKYSFGPSQILSKGTVIKEVPGVLAKKLKGGVTYHDGQFDDARLAMTLARTMADMGGSPLTTPALPILLRTPPDMYAAFRLKTSSAARATKSKLSLSLTLQVSSPMI